MSGIDEDEDMVDENAESSKKRQLRSSHRQKCQPARENSSNVEQNESPEKIPDLVPYYPNSENNPPSTNKVKNKDEISEKIPELTPCFPTTSKTPLRKPCVRKKYTFVVRSGASDPGTADYLRHDFLTNTRYERVIAKLLLERGVWREVSDRAPAKMSYLDIAWLGTDINTKLDKDDFFISEHWQKGEASQEEKYTWAMQCVKNRISPRVRKFRGVYKNCRIFAKSRTTNRIPIITVLTTDKAILCQLFQHSFPLEWFKWIPPFMVFNTEEVLHQPEQFNERLQEFLSHHQAVRWVLRPTGGSRQRALNVIQKSRLPKVIPTVVTSEEGQDFKRWILSKFILSFLWKFKGPANSRQLVDTHHLHPVLKPPTDTTETRPTERPEAIKDLVYDDQVGRTNKARYWFAIDVTDTEIKVYLHDTVMFEISGKEHVWGKFDQDKIIPENGLKLFRKTFNLDKVTAQRAFDLDHCHNIRGEGEDFDAVHPLGKGTFRNIVIPNIIRATKKVMVVLQDYIIHRGLVHLQDNKLVTPVSCFQYFGTDILVDDDANVWILELNSRPWCGFGRWWETWDPNYKHCESIYSFFDSMFEVLVDPYFPPSTKPEKVEGALKGRGKLWSLIATFPRVTVSPTMLKVVAEMKDTYKKKEQPKEQPKESCAKTQNDTPANKSESTSTSPSISTSITTSTSISSTSTSACTSTSTAISTLKIQ